MKSLITLDIFNHQTKDLAWKRQHPNAETKASVDASSHGLGAVLLQQVNVQWHPIEYAFRSLTDT